MLSLKEQSNKIVWPQFFHYSNLPGHWPMGLHICNFGWNFVYLFYFFRISLGYNSSASLSHRGMIPQRVNLPRVWYPSESISPGPGYDIPVSQSPGDVISLWVNLQRYDILVSQSPRGMISRWVNLPGVWYPGESISRGYDIPVSQSPRGMISRWVNLPLVWYPGESISRGYISYPSKSTTNPPKTWLLGVCFFFKP